MAGRSKKEMHPWFKEKMEARGWENLFQMSRDTGFNTQTLRHYAYNGRRGSDWVFLKKLADTLCVSTDEFIMSMCLDESEDMQAV